MNEEMRLLSGKVESIGETQGKAILHRHESNNQCSEERLSANFADHVAALTQILEFLETHVGNLQSLIGIGHRVVHGGESFQAATLINQQVIEEIRKTIPLAPLHNPANLLGIKTLNTICPEVPQVAVFDTAFFHTLPPRAFRYAVPQQWYEDYQVRRYGFHGTSHQYVARGAANFLQRPLRALNLITLHLGNGASAAAIQNGQCIDTSMGMTPMEGLVMGTRCGDIDPALVFYLSRNTGMDLNEIETLLNQHSGLKGLCGEGDMREVHRLANGSDGEAQLAIDIFCYRICKYVGAYYVALGRIDGLVFTGGVGEHDDAIRQQVCQQLSLLGIEVDPLINQDNKRGNREISTTNSKVRVLVIATNEELEIARQTAQLVQP